MDEEIVIDTEDIKEFIYDELVERGYAIQESFISEIADLVFEYLLIREVIDEVIESD